MVLHLAAVLEIPLREQNLLLKAAGYAPAFRETDLGAPEVTGIRKALTLILRQQDPYSAVAVTPRWDVVMANQGFTTTLIQTLGRNFTPLVPLEPPQPNMLRLLFDPRGLRSQLTNWDIVARTVLARAYREALWNRDTVLETLVRELASSLEPAWQTGMRIAETELVIPIEVREGDQTLKFFNTITTLGAPMDVTLQELRIEVFHPADEATDQFVRAQGKS